MAVPSDGLWGAAQVIGVLLTLVLVGGLATVPDTTLDILWNAVIPILPAAFLLAPSLWRNVCPLATLNMLGGGRRVLTARVATGASAIGIVLLFVLVPARRFLFNENGPALAVTILAVASLALLAGALFSAKAGFCNAICPVLPVERLYGQEPLLRVRQVRCRRCVRCTQTACIDLSARESVRQTFGARADGTGWVFTPFGIFALAFPGFVIGYFTTSDGPLSTWAAVYGHVGAWSGASLALLGAITLVGRVPALWMTRLCGVAALVLYYWFGAPGIAQVWALPGVFVVGVRATALALALVWLPRALRGARRRLPAEGARA
ncbi:MAG: hypothetical protein D6701_00075 [Gemmatimonadetes bacterium]|nr:MAG: hypothetical protein D6701_00075 [Gemmatimonadota bacterium]